VGGSGINLTRIASGTLTDAQRAKVAGMAEDKKLARGSANAAAALKVSVAVERIDIADLQTAGVGVTAPDVKLAYSRLIAGSRQHLVAFRR